MEKWQSPNRIILLNWIKECLLVEKNLSVWEADFCKSLHYQLKNGKELTRDQVNKLESIYADKTN
jgi:hypothetical protein